MHEKHNKDKESRNFFRKFAELKEKSPLSPTKAGLTPFSTLNHYSAPDPLLCNEVK